MKITVNVELDLDDNVDVSWLSQPPDYISLPRWLSRASYLLLQEAMFGASEEATQINSEV